MNSLEQKNQLQSYFDMLPDQIALLDEAGNVAMMNAAAAKGMGIDRDAAIGKPLDFALMAPRYGEKMARLPDFLAAVMAGEVVQRFETASPAPDGPVFAVSLQRAANECCFSGALLTIHDMTKRAKTRNELLKRNSELTEILAVNRTIMEINSAIHSGSTLDEMFEIIFDQLKRIIPYDRIGLSLLDEKLEFIAVAKVRSDNPILLPKGYRIHLASTNLPALLNPAASWRDAHSVMAGGKYRIIYDLKEYVVDKKRDSHYNATLLKEGIRSSLTVPLYVEGKPTAILFFSSRTPGVYTPEYMGRHYDTCMKSLAAVQENLAVALEKSLTITRLEETNRRLEELLAMKDDFLSIASHDLRSPLTAIIGFGKMMAEKTVVTEMQRRGLEIMVNSAGHLLTLVDDILALAKTNAASMEVNLAATTVGDILLDSISAMSFNAHNKEIVLEHVPLTPSPELALDRSKIFQVFNNLISNAIKFSPVGGTVILRESVTNGSYRFEVEDSGPGISGEDQKKLFTKFVQVGDEAAKAKGTGLGLAICKMIVNGHGGDIGVGGELGKGAVFHFTLPLKGKGNAGD
ncbi:MAG: PAS domain S-box protein [Nitrospinae bacterium]|nr:PAS domain S-box protein [Nitrospinota bacterium]